MSGVRLTATALVVFCAFLWTVFVVESWHKNISAREINSAKVNETQNEHEKALGRADELALAASEEFNKYTKNNKPASEQTLAKVPSAKVPSKTISAIDVPSDEAKQKIVAAGKISSPAKKVKDEASTVAKSVEVRVSSLADNVKDNGVGDAGWKVPTAVSPVYGNSDVAEKGDFLDKKKTDKTFVKTEHRVSDVVGVSKYEPIKMAQKRIAIAKTTKDIMTDVIDERALEQAGRIESQVESRLSILTATNGPLDFADHDVARDGKDDARLSKDYVTVAASKHRWVVPDGVTPVYDVEKTIEVVKHPKPIWTVPTGVTPEGSVVVQLERGLDSVADAAVEAGSDLVKSVAAIGDNVKGAIASTKKWEVPTGVTPGEGEKAVKVAALDVKKQVKPLGKTTSKLTIDASKLKKTKGEVSKGKPEMMEENQVAFSSQLRAFKGDVDDQDAANNTDASTSEQKKNGKSLGLMDRLIGLLTKDDKKIANNKGSSDDPYHISRIEKVRFKAIKNLMVENINYKFTNVKKGKGQIVISGRAQSDAKLSLYVDVRYLGDVTADNDGSWVFTKELYIPKGQHMVQAQQMSQSGLPIARKTLPFIQKQNAKAPKGYIEGIGIELGDKALATLRNKLKKDNGNVKLASVDTGEKTKKKLTKAEIRQAKAFKRLAARTPLPVRKLKDKALAKLVDKKAELTKKVELVKKAKLAKKAENKKLAMLAKQESAKSLALLAEASKNEKLKAEKAKISSVSKESLKKKALSVNKARYYVVKAGDTLGKIAMINLGSVNKYKDILRLNKKLKSANRIYPGQKLLIAGGDADLIVPEKNKKVAALGKIKVPLKKAVSKSAEKKIVDAKTKAVPKPGADIYVVKAGDSLWKIAKTVYGNGQRYKDIIKLNPKLSGNPGAIRPKMKLRVKAS